MSGTRSSGRARSSCSKPQRLIVHRLSRVTDRRLDLNRGDSRDGEASSPGCCSREGTAPGGSVPAEPVPARHTGQVGGAVTVRVAGPGSRGWRCARCAAGRLWGPRRSVPRLRSPGSACPRTTCSCCGLTRPSGPDTEGPLLVRHCPCRLASGLTSGAWWGGHFGVQWSQAWASCVSPTSIPSANETKVSAEVAQAGPLACRAVL